MMFRQPRKLLAAALISFILLLTNIITPAGQGNLATTWQKSSAPIKAAFSSTSLFKSSSAPSLSPGNSNPAPAEPTPTPFAPISPELQRFVSQVSNGEAEVVVGVFVEGTLALPVIQQPQGNSAFVSTEWDVITEFSSAARRGVTGLLAHNYLSGIQFYDLQIGQKVVVVYGDGSLRRYQITDSRSFQKLSPSSLQSDLIDLSSGDQLTTSQVFNQFYAGEHHVTFQTCLKNRGVSNWGLTFWVATPVDL